MVRKETLITLYSDVQTTPVNWLWYPYIAIGKITILQGDPGDGKSTMMLHLIAELSRGGHTPDGASIGLPQRVIYQCSEDGAGDTIKPRLESCGANCHNIAFINEEVYSGLTLDDERLRQAITTFRPRLVVIDPIQAYIGCDSDLQAAARARKLMRRISMWASVYECAFVLIGHMNKRESSKGLYRSLGSIDVVAAARSVLQVERCVDNENVRIVRQIKNSLAPEGPEIRFSILPKSGFNWESYGVVEKPVEAHDSLELPHTKHELAALLLKRLLKDGPVESRKIKETMMEYSIGDKTMQEVKAELGIKSFRKMRVWFWNMMASI